MDSFEIKFSGKVLERGFWLYVVQMTNPKNQRFFYVGMTGDSAALKAAALFVRLGRHLDVKENAMGNTLFRAIKNEKKLLPFLYQLDFEIIGFYLSPENEKAHRKIRGEISHMEDKLHKDLKDGGYEVLGFDWPIQKPIVSIDWQKKYEEILEETKYRFKK